MESVVYMIERKYGLKESVRRLRKEVKEFEFKGIYYKLLVILFGCRGRCLVNRKLLYILNVN